MLIVLSLVISSNFLTRASRSRFLLQRLPGPRGQCPKGQFAVETELIARHGNSGEHHDLRLKAPTLHEVDVVSSPGPIKI